MVTFRPFHGVSSKVLTVLSFWWLGRCSPQGQGSSDHYPVCLWFDSVKVLTQKQHLSSISLLSPLLFQDNQARAKPLALGALTGQGSGFCRWLHPIHRQLGEENEEFALRVQQVAVNMGLVEVGSLSRGEGEEPKKLQL